MTINISPQAKLKLEKMGKVISIKKVFSGG